MIWKLGSAWVTLSRLTVAPIAPVRLEQPASGLSNPLDRKPLRQTPVPVAEVVVPVRVVVPVLLAVSVVWVAGFLVFVDSVVVVEGQDGKMSQQSESCHNRLSVWGR